ncbi:MAG: autotransporter outer membrane beta-barrel domain-containing protein [Proteobacteria bacterium]|nr:autotransporter outer membrane beta-barrel domain-containing protein [Pseudomonadota bacterium]
MKNKLLVTTALVGLAFASSAMAADELKEYEAGSVISADDTGHTKGDTRISFMGDAKLEKDVTFGNYVTLHNKTNLTGDKKLTVTGYLTQTEAGSDVSGVDLEIQKGKVNNSQDSEVTEGELVLGNNLTVGNVNMADGTGIYLYKTEEDYAKNADKTLTIADGKEVTFAGNNYIKGAKDAALTLDGKGSVANQGELTVSNALTSSVDIKNAGTITLDKGYTGNGNYLGNDFASNKDTTINIKGDVSLDNNARIVAATANDLGSVKITDAGNITLRNGSTIDAVNLNISGKSADEKAIITIGGNNPSAGRETDENEQWRNNSYILGYGDTSIKNANISLENGGMLIQGAKGTNEAPDTGTMTLNNSEVKVAEGALIKATNGSDVALENASVDLNGGIIDAKISVDTNSKINVNNAGSTIKTLAGTGTLNINANTSVSTLFGSASKIGTLAVKEGSTFILDSLDEVKENESEGTEARDAVNLTADTMEVSGTAIVADNNANTITDTKVNNGGTLDLGYNTFSSNVTMDAGSTLNVGVKNADKAPAGELTHGNINGDLTVNAPGDEGAANASMNLIIAADTKFGDESKINLATGGNLDNLVVNNNLLYNLEGVEDGKITGTEIKVSKKDSSEVAAGVAANGANGNQAGTIAAFVDGLSGNAQADNITNQISTLVQSGNVKGAARLAKEVAPVAAPVAQSQVTETTNQVFGAVATRLSGGSVSSAAEGKSSGDSVFERAAMWVQGLFNKSKYDGSNDFKTDSTGLALGAEKYLNSDVKVGAGYAYTNSDVKQGDRKIDVDTHTAFVYGEYKPSDWYVNGIASYNWGDYDEKKYGGLSGKYDVNSIALQAMTGYDFHMNGAVVTPEAGLRYINIHQDSYTDTAGQRVSENSSDYLTGIVGAKIKKDYTLSNGMNIRPEARLAMTYDLVNDNSNASVMLANGSAYQVRGEALDRFGVEAGVGLTAEVDDNVEVSLGYEGKFRDHYKDHTGLLNAKYKF